MLGPPCVASGLFKKAVCRGRLAFEQMTEPLVQLAPVEVDARTYRYNRPSSHRSSGVKDRLRASTFSCPATFSWGFPLISTLSTRKLEPNRMLFLFMS